MVRYIVGSRQLEWAEKYDYIKLLRAQLSNHEQAMIFFNSIWLKRKTWWEDHGNRDERDRPYRYFLDFAFIKNVPWNLTEQLGPNVYEHFANLLGTAPYFINPDQPEVSKQKKLNWLFEWGGVE